MNINLRRAAALQNTIQEVIRTMNPVTTIHLNEFQDPELTIAQAHAELTKNLERRDSLIMALYEIRRLAGDANSAAGIDRRLTDAALLEKLDASRKLLDIHLLRSDLFSYLAWLEDHRDHGDFNVKGKDYLVLASDSTTCWGRTFMEAVQIAEQHDRKLFDAARKEAQP